MKIFITFVLIFSHQAKSSDEKCFEFIQTENNIPIKAGDWAEVDGNILQVRSFHPEVTTDIYDLNTGKKLMAGLRNMSGADNEGNLYEQLIFNINSFNSDESFRRAIENFSVKKVNPTTGETQLFKNKVFSKLWGGLISLEIDDQNVVKITAPSGKYLKLNRQLWSKSPAMNMKNEEFYLLDNDKIKVYDREMKLARKIDLPKNTGCNSINQISDSQLAECANFTNYSRKIVDMSTGKVLDFPLSYGRLLNVYSTEGLLQFEKKIITANDLKEVHGFNKEGLNILVNKNTLCRDEYMKLSCQDIKSKTKIDFNINDIISTSTASYGYPSPVLLPSGKAALKVNDNFLVVSKSKICKSTFVKVNCNCEFAPPATGFPAIESLKQSLLEIACKSDFNPELWKELTSTSANTISEQEAAMWLLRFSKPGGFESSKHLNIFLGILQSGLQHQYPFESLIVINKISAENHKIGSYIKDNFHLPPENIGTRHMCWSENEKATFGKTLLEQLKNIISKYLPDNISAETLDSDVYLAKQYLTTEQRKDLADVYADKLVERQRYDYEYSALFPSKVYYFAYNHLLNKLEVSAPNVVDVTTVRSKGYQDNSVRIFKLSHDLCEGCKKTPYGFFIKEYPKFSVSQMEEENEVNFKFENKGQIYTAKIDLRKIKQKELFDNKPEPNYQELWKDNVLKGLIIVGSNAKGQEGQTVFDQYKYYYQQRGFVFDKPSVGVDTKQILKNNMHGAEQADYFIKEAHTGGDEKNMIHLDKKSKVLRGTKVVGDKKEVVELVYPADDSSGTEYLKNTEFSDWITERHKGGGGQLLYLNSSCNSVGKAIYEIPALADKGGAEVAKKVINIASPTLVYFFRNKPESLKVTFLDGIRSNQSYQDMRSKFVTDTHYKSGSNQFLFPDDVRYRDTIGSLVSDPVLIDVKMWKGSGENQQPYVVNFGAH